MDKEAKELLTFAGVFAGTFSFALFTIMGTVYLFNHIEDTIKFNRYNEALKEYRECAQKYQDEYSVRTYCGDFHSSDILI
jgi:hypothetical protein